MLPKDEIVPTAKGKEKIVNIMKRIVHLREIITVEPMVLGYVIAKAMIDPVLKTLEMDKSCRVNSHFNNTVCKAIINGTYENKGFVLQNNIVQSHITAMHSWQLTTTNILSIILILFLGSFSDRHRVRKPFILMALFGQTLALCGCLLCVYFMEQWPLEVLGFLQEVLYSMFGGEKMLLMIIFAYIADISTPKMRTLRMSVILAIYNIGTTIGQTLGGMVLPIVGYTAMLGAALLLFVMSFLYGVFGIIESKMLDDDKTENKWTLSDIVNPQYITRTFQIFTKYTGTPRVNIISVLVVSSIYSIVNNGEMSVLFLFTQTAYEWTTKQYSLFFAMITVANSVGLFVIVPFFTKVLRLDDLVIVALSYASKVVTNVIIITYRTSIGLYIGCLTGILRTLALVSMRSQLTKYVSQDDVGKILSLFSVVDSFGEAAASQIYNNGIYEYTRSKFPHAFLLLGIALHLVGILILMWMYTKKKEEEQKTCDKNPSDKKQQEQEKEIEDIPLGIEITHL